jgi:hypothetical protein
MADRKYSEDEAAAIIRRALERKELVDHVSHSELVETAKEMGLSAADVEAAVVEEAKSRALADERAEWLARRQRQLRGSVAVWLWVSALCLAINLLAGGPWWFQWVLVPWGFLQLFPLMRLRLGPTEEQLERLRRRRERRLRRSQRRAQLAESAKLFEHTVNEGVAALLELLERRHLPPPRR